MAKAKRTGGDPAKAPAAAAAPAPTSQPWAKGDSEGIPPADAPAASTPPEQPALVGTGEEGGKQAEVRDQLTPSGDPDAAHDAARADTEGGNGGGTDNVPSEAVDQHTPSGPNPSEVDAKAEKLTPDNHPDRVAAEAKDQVTPVGEDLSSVLHPLIADTEDFSDEEKAELEAHMRDQAFGKVQQIKRRRKAVAMEAAFVNGNKIFGNAARRPAKPSEE